MRTTLLLWLSTFCCFAQFPFSGVMWYKPAASASVNTLTVDYYVHLTNSTPNTLITAAIFNSGTSPGGANPWTRAGTSGHGVGDRVNGLHSQIKIGSTTYPTSWPNLSYVCTNNVTGRYMQFGTTITSRKVTVAGFVFLGPPANSTGGGGLWDLYYIGGSISGTYCVMQLDANGSGSSYNLNVESNPSGSTIHSATITVSPQTWYWCSFYSDWNIGSNRLDVFRISDWTSVGSVTYTNSSGEDISPVRVGQGEFGTATGTTNWFENTVIAVGANAIAPLGP